MANVITDNRTLINAADAVTGWENSSSTVTLDTDVKIQGTGSLSEQLTNSRKTMIYNMGSTQNWSNNVFYIWVNCGVVGLLSTKAAGGFTVRFTGPTTTDYFEFYVGGSNSWPNAIAGGWVQFVVDIEATPSATGGTPPLTSAIQHIGVTGITSAMTKVAENTWVDAIWRLADGNPGIIVEGRNGGTTDWTFANIFTQLTAASGTIKEGPGGSYVINTPLQFGINDTSTHGFTDTNVILLWDNQEFAPSDLYKISALGNAGGTTNVTFGVKTGTGDDATGAQGTIIAAASTGVRWAMDFDDANINGANFYGCTFIHGGDFQLDGTAISSISTSYIDCSSATISNSKQLRIKVIDANTADGVAFMTTDDLTDIVFGSFEFSDGHGVMLTTPIVSTQTSKGNTFTGYGATASNDAAVYNNAGGAVTINVTSSGTSPTYRNGAGASTNVVASVNVAVHVENSAGTNIANAQVFIRKAAAYYNYTSHNTNNLAGDATFDVNEAVDTDLPQSGWLHVWDASANEKQNYRYASWSGTTFTLPSAITGSATSAGTSTTLNSTGIGSSGIQEGDTIRNTSDTPVSWAVVDELNANSATTTPLQGGTTNEWQNTNGYQVNRLAIDYVNTDLVDIPLFNGQTNATGDIATTFGGATPASITLRIRSNEGTPKYIPFNTSGTITSSGFTYTAILTEDTVAI